MKGHKPKTRMRIYLSRIPIFLNKELPILRNAGIVDLPLFSHRCLPGSEPLGRVLAERKPGQSSDHQSLQV